MSNMSRIMKLASEQKKRSLAILLLGTFGTGLAVYGTIGFSIPAVTIHLVCAFIAIRFMAFISVVTLQRKYYNGDIQSFIADVNAYEALKKSGQLSTYDPSAEVEMPQKSKSIEITVVDYPEKPAGSFKDAPIFDWLVIEVEGKRFKVQFEGVLNVVEGQDLNLEHGQILLAPGILYSKVA